jgi:hypothetical protein
LCIPDLGPPQIFDIIDTFRGRAFHRSHVHAIMVFKLLKYTAFGFPVSIVEVV